MFLRYGTLEKTFKLVTLFSLLLIFMPTLVFAKSQVSILAFGDSLTAGYELLPSDSFPAQLQTALRKKGIAATVHNAGVSGDTTTGGKARLAWVLKGQKQQLDVVILELGANDSLRGINPDITRANLDVMIGRLKKTGTKIILAGMLAPPNMGADYAKKYNSIYPDLAEKHNVLLYPFFMDGVVLNPKLQLSDGMHPNKQGVGVIVAKMLPIIISTLPKK
jgi:acyl-CoA thioesterase I